MTGSKAHVFPVVSVIKPTRLFRQIVEIEWLPRGHFVVNAPVEMFAVEFITGYHQ